MYFPPLLSVSYSLRGKGKLFLIIFLHHTLPRPSDRFPAINSLIQKINLRKRRDSLILGGVIGVCTILLLLYTFHWWHRQTVKNINCKSDQVFFYISFLLLYFKSSQRWKITVLERKGKYITFFFYISLNWKFIYFTELWEDFHLGVLYIAACILL